MIAVLASQYDETARWLVSRWAEAGGVLLTCEDLSSSGWRYNPATPLDGSAVLGGREVALKDIRGVLTRLPALSALELHHIVPADRPYVAAEMTAFLTCWLSGFPIPVLNRPSPGSLTGPNFRAEQWAAIALKLGVRIRSTSDRLGLSPLQEAQHKAPTTVTVIGKQCFGEAASALFSTAAELARTMGVELLGVHFDTPDPDALFLSVTTSPSIDTPELADAVLDHFTTLAGKEIRG
jgi:hypothetical protein